MGDVGEQAGSEAEVGNRGSVNTHSLHELDSSAARGRLSCFFGSKAFASSVKPGRRHDKLIAEQRARVYLPGMPRQRARLKGPAKSGITPRLEVSHADAIDAIRCSIVSRPVVQTQELMAEYKSLKNKIKRLRRLLRGKKS